MPEEANAKGLKAREYMCSQYNTKKVAETMMRRFQEIEQELKRKVFLQTMKQHQKDDD